MLSPEPLDAITDVAGVRVGHTTLIRSEFIRTGVTVVLPPGDNLFREKVPGAVYVGNSLFPLHWRWVPPVVCTFSYVRLLHFRQPDNTMASITYRRMWAARNSPSRS